MNSRYRVTGAYSETTHDPFGPGLTVVVLELERQVQRQVAVRTPKEQVEEAIEQSTRQMKGKVSEDTLKMTREMTLGVMLPLAGMGAQAPPDPVIHAMVELTEDEYYALGRPAYGDWVELDVGIQQGVKPIGPDMVLVKQRPTAVYRGVPGKQRTVKGAEKPTDAQTLDYALPRVKAAIEKLDDTGSGVSRDALLGFLRLNEGMMKERLIDQTVDVLIREGFVFEVRPGVYRKVR